MSLYLATTHGLVIASRVDGAWRVDAHGTLDREITCVMAREGVILAGTIDGVFRSDDAGRTWRKANAGLSHRHVRWLAYHPDISDLEFAGTEPAAIFVSRDGAATWRECGEVAALRDQFEWFLPYSSEAGCVRSFAFNGPRVYAAVEVGGVLRSDDEGASWRLVEGSDGHPLPDSGSESALHPDVHSIEVHPLSPDLVYASTGSGFYRSWDGGKTWRCVYDCYCRAAWVDPHDLDHILLGPADDVSYHGRIEETRDGGQTWQLASTGLKVPWRSYMVERFLAAGNEVLAVLSNGDLLAAPMATLEWRRILPDIGGVNAVAVMG